MRLELSVGRSNDSLVAGRGAARRERDRQTGDGDRDRQTGDGDRDRLQRLERHRERDRQRETQSRV